MKTQPFGPKTSSLQEMKGMQRIHHLRIDLLAAHENVQYCGSSWDQSPEWCVVWLIIGRALPFLIVTLVADRRECVDVANHCDTMGGWSRVLVGFGLSDSDFYNQRLKAWHPILTPKWVIVTFGIVALVFIPLGIGLLVTSRSVRWIQCYPNGMYLSLGHSFVALGERECVFPSPSLDAGGGAKRAVWRRWVKCQL